MNTLYLGKAQYWGLVWAPPEAVDLKHNNLETSNIVVGGQYDR